MTDLDTRQPEFTATLRGYDRLQVDEYIERLQQLLSEAEERARSAEIGDYEEHTAVGPRVAQIFELAAGEARELRISAQRQAQELLGDAETEAREIIQEAREIARDTAERTARDHEVALADHEHERHQKQAEVADLEDQRTAVLAELRRLYDALGSASGIVSAAQAAAPAGAESPDVGTPIAADGGGDDDSGGGDGHRSLEAIEADMETLELPRASMS